MNNDDPSPVPLAGQTSLIEKVALLVDGNDARPSWDDYFMSAALLVSLRSACERLHVGCVLVSGGKQKNRIIAAGYNGFLPGVSHRSLVRDGHEQATVHAEQNAIADAAKRGISVLDATAYVTHFPCLNCSKILVSSGICAIKYHWDYKNDPLSVELLDEAGVSIQNF